MEPDLLREWVASETGSEVRQLAPLGGGASRATWLASLADDSEVVVRAETGAGPLAGTELTLAREAIVYRALRDGPVAIPRLVAEHPSGNALLVERAPGSDAFAALPAGEQQLVAEAYARRLAVLHGLDPGKLDLPGFAPGVPGGDTTGAELSLWRRIARERVPELAPAPAFAFEWLASRPLPGRALTSLCHGDAGPGNFLFERSSVSALLDWEFAHLGDPHDDLAWIVVRAHLLGGFGDLAGVFRAWADQSGVTPSVARVEHFTPLVLLRMAVACQAGLAHSREGAMDATVFSLLLPYLAWLLPQALERAGCRDPALAELHRLGEAAVAAVPVLQSHARPLAPLELP